MSGLFGILHTQPSPDTRPFLEQARQKMFHQPWYTSETWAAPDECVGIGRIGIGIFNQESQPYDAGSGCLAWLCGELYQTQGLIEKLQRLNLAPRDSSHLALVHAAYRAFGVCFAQALEGVFFTVILDREKGLLLLANDRFGLYPHYYKVENKRLIFAPEVKGILAAPGVARRLNVTAASEYLRFQQLLGEKTFHEGIHLFPYGSAAQFDLREGTLQIHRYWDWDQVPDRPTISFGDATEEAGNLLEGAVQRLGGGEVRTGVFLSGGLDSRSILGFLAKYRPRPISATFGAHQSRDVIYARKIAAAVGSHHFWYDLPDGNWVAEYADFHLQLTEGFHSWIHMHGINILPGIRGEMDCNLTGWDGGTVMGHSDHINTIYNHPVDEWTVALRTYQQFNQAYTWPGLTDAEERLLFTPEFGREAVGRAFDSMRQEFSRFWNYRQHYAAEYFYIVNHCWRFTHHMVTTTRSALEVRFPYWDYQLIDFIYSLLPAIRRDQWMFRSIITQRLPRLSLIPYDKQEYLPSVNRLLYATQKTAMRALKWARVFPHHPQLYADYENFLRHELRPWAEGILFDSRTTQRGIFDPLFVRSLINRHVAGHEPWILGKIAPLITLELVLREFFD
jgi:asparagine synthase (glutamine-hydrolysing)